MKWTICPFALELGAIWNDVLALFTGTIVIEKTSALTAKVNSGLKHPFAVTVIPAQSGIGFTFHVQETYRVDLEVLTFTDDDNIVANSFTADSRPTTLADDAPRWLIVACHLGIVDTIGRKFVGSQGCYKAKRGAETSVMVVVIFRLEPSVCRSA